MTYYSPTLWKKRYISTLMKKGGLTKIQGEEYYEAGSDSHDFNEDPVDSALMEITYWES